MRVAVTGATGFAGGHTLRALVDAGHEPVPLVRDESKLRSVEQLHGLEPLTGVIGDICDPGAVTALCDGADALIHTAAVAFIGPRHRAAIEATNVPGTRLVLEAATARELDPVVHLSSTSALHPPPGGRYHRDNPVSPTPLGDYSRSKAESEQIARQLQDAGHPVTIVWPSGIAGPDDVGCSVMAEGTAKLLQTGVLPLATSGGNLMHDVRDLATVLARLMEPGLGARRYGVFGHFLSWPDMAAVVQEVSGATLRTPTIPNWVFAALGRFGDLVGRVGVEPPLDSATAAFMTGLVPGDDRETRDELGVEWRPIETTMGDMLRWLVATGRLDARRAPALHA